MRLLIPVKALRKLRIKILHCHLVRVHLILPAFTVDVALAAISGPVAIGSLGRLALDGVIVLAVLVYDFVVLVGGANFI